MAGQRHRGGLKLYVRVLERVDGRYRKVYNKTFDVEEYVDFLEMMVGIREALWRSYTAKRGYDILYSRPPSSLPTAQTD